jgi:type VI secretion system protein ImpB
MKVDNALANDGSKLGVELNFKSMDDFEPENVAKQVRPLRELLELRTRLSDLRGSLQGNDKLEELLLGAVGNQDKLAKLKKEMGDGGSNG